MNTFCDVYDDLGSSLRDAVVTSDSLVQRLYFMFFEEKANDL